MVMFGAGAVAVILAFTVLGTFAARGVRSSSDYTVAGRKANSFDVGGILLGALVGGASTVGTVEMAYQFGLSAWWFTLGGGIGCLILGTWFAGPLRKTGLSTIPELLEGPYGRVTGGVALAASTLGTFISVVAQVLAGVAMLQAIIPLSATGASAGVAVSVLCFILFGGIKSYGAMGKAKIAFLYVVLAVCTLMTLYRGTTLPYLVGTFPEGPWFDLFGRGFAVDLNSGISLVVGVMTTQIYLQALFAATDARTARRGALLSAALMPPLGLLAIWIGLGMRAREPGLAASQVLPLFISQNFPPLVAGCLWSGIYITIIGTAAGLCLGIATNLSRDLFPRLLGRPLPDHLMLRLSQMGVLGLVLLASILGRVGLGSLILSWSYLSMGLRGAGTFFPLAIAILAPGRLRRGWALASSLLGLGIALGWPLTGLPGDPLVTGLCLSALCCLLGWTRKGTA